MFESCAWHVHNIDFEAYVPSRLLIDLISLAFSTEKKSMTARHTLENFTLHIYSKSIQESLPLLVRELLLPSSQGPPRNEVLSSNPGLFECPQLKP